MTQVNLGYILKSRLRQLPDQDVGGSGVSAYTLVINPIETSHLFRIELEHNPKHQPKSLNDPDKVLPANPA